MPEENKAQKEPEDEGFWRSNWFFWLISAGFALVFIGALFTVLAAVFATQGSGSTGIIIFIGPFPIVFGSGPDAWCLVLVGVVVAVASVVLFWVWYRKLGREEGD